MKNVIKVVGKYFLKNPSILIGLGLWGTSLTAATLADKGVIKFKDKGKETLFGMMLGGTVALADVCIISGVVDGARSYLADTSMVCMKAGTVGNKVLIGNYLSKMPESTLLTGAWSKEDALVLAEAIVKAANTIKGA